MAFRQSQSWSWLAGSRPLFLRGKLPGVGSYIPPPACFEAAHAVFHSMRTVSWLNTRAPRPAGCSVRVARGADDRPACGLDRACPTLCGPTPRATNGPSAPADTDSVSAAVISASRWLPRSVTAGPRARVRPWPRRLRVPAAHHNDFALAALRVLRSRGLPRRRGPRGIWDTARVRET